MGVISHISWLISHLAAIRAIEPRSCVKTILRYEPLSHLATIRAIEPWSNQAKPRSKPPSQDPSHRASEPRSEPSSRNTIWAEIQSKPSWAKIFELFFCYQTQGFIKITPWVWGRILKNKFHCIPHCLDVFIIYHCFINKTSHKYCKYKNKILIKI